jgi:hypothetical protein
MFFEVFSSVIIVFAIYLAWSCLWCKHETRIPPVPVMPKIKRRAIQLAEKYSDREAPYHIADLGAGWGGVLVALSRRYKNATLTGYELSPWPYRFAKIRAALNRRRFDVRKEDFFTADISNYDIVYCYLSPTLMSELIPQFKTMKAGALIVSCSFEIASWTPLAKEVITGLVDIPIYIYRRPE